MLHDISSRWITSKSWIAPVIIIAGGLGALVQVTVLEAVAVLPQASVAVNVLVSEARMRLLTLLHHYNDRVGVPQPSVAVAEPRAAVIADEVGLHPRVVIAPVMMIDGGV